MISVYRHSFLSYNFNNIFRDFRPVIKGFETFASNQLRSEERPHPAKEEGYDWPDLKVVSVALEMKLCSKKLIIEHCRVVLADCMKGIN